MFLSISASIDALDDDSLAFLDRVADGSGPLGDLETRELARKIAVVGRQANAIRDVLRQLASAGALQVVREME